ncbi:hypothetical protein GUB55_25735 [Escherichia coli]|nr:hypothetical protein [Escherichia coli]
MADFGSTKYNVSFEAWHELLMDYAELRGGSARKDHIVITPLSGLTKKSVRSAVKSAVQLWSHLTGCSLWRKEKPDWQMM